MGLRLQDGLTAIVLLSFPGCDIGERYYPHTDYVEIITLNRSTEDIHLDARPDNEEGAGNWNKLAPEQSRSETQSLVWEDPKTDGFQTKIINVFAMRGSVTVGRAIISVTEKECVTGKTFWAYWDGKVVKTFSNVLPVDEKK